jgi:N-methylhydantoinase A/oxoprolinase/acetone carboxylase beta subunit
MEEARKKQTSGEKVILSRGLGIDAGGTYTDVVVYDFKSKTLIAKAKSLTTPWDFTIGIKKALSMVEMSLLKKVDLVCVSTTLATNAIVQGKGRTVGLLVMPPYGFFEPSDISHSPIRVISGRLEIDGRVIEPVDEREVRMLGKELISRSGVEAFAVSGFASTINPEHEIQVKKILRDETGLCVTCGHELSELLNFRTRAVTAILNARIIPQVEQFIRELKKTLLELNISVPIAVVKGDGSVTSVGMALERPVETILSGPAASVAGARQLTGLQDAMVIDMGGTSTDSASVTKGFVKRCSEGAVVGGKKTHVQALDMRTIGLGGDSRIWVENGQIRIGAISVGSIAMLGSLHKGLAKTFDWLQKNIESYKITSEPMEILALNEVKERVSCTQDEREIVEALEERPRSIDELAELTEAKYWRLVHIDRMEKECIVQRFALTPTDLLHVSEKDTRLDRISAETMTEMISFVAGLEKAEFVEYVLEKVSQEIAMELLNKLIHDMTGHEQRIQGDSAFRLVIDNWLGKRHGNFGASFTLKVPVIGVGAPVHYFLPRAMDIFSGEHVIPKHADVANAIGAITSRVVICKHAKIFSLGNDEFNIEGLVKRKTFSSLDEANEYAVTELCEMVREMGSRAGTDEKHVDVSKEDTYIEVQDGEDLFLERTLTATLSGSPDIPKLAEEGIL